MDIRAPRLRTKETGPTSDPFFFTRHSSKRNSLTLCASSLNRLHKTRIHFLLDNIFSTFLLFASSHAETPAAPVYYTLALKVPTEASCPDIRILTLAATSPPAATLAVLIASAQNTTCRSDRRPTVTDATGALVPGGPRSPSPISATKARQRKGRNHHRPGLLYLVESLRQRRLLRRRIQRRLPTSRHRPEHPSRPRPAPRLGRPPHRRKH